MVIKSWYLISSEMSVLVRHRSDDILWRHTNHSALTMVILSLPLIQEGQLSVSSERMCTILVNCL